MLTIAYLYKWTEINTGKWYIGSRASKGCHPNDNYICSSKIVKPLIIENPTRWKREILVIGNPQYIVNLEKEYLQSLDAKNNSMSFNLHNGDGIFSQAGRTPWNKGKESLFKGTPRPDSVKEKISNALKGKKKSEEHIKNMLKSKKERTIVAWNKGKKMSEEFRQTLKEAFKNRKIPESQIERLKKLAKDRKGKPSPLKGKKQPESQGKKISEFQKGRKKPKQVCRLKDKKEMSLSHFNQWLNRESKE